MFMHLTGPLRTNVALAVLVAAGALFGCSAPVGGVAGSPDGVDAEAISPATAIVVIERTTTPASATGTGESTRAEAIARFVRMRAGAVDDQALRMVGVAVDLPPLGTCAALSEARAPAAPARALELADVGPITVESQNARTSLSPRQVPDPVGLVSGVVYSARAADPAGLPSGGRFTFRAGATELDVAPFSVVASAPKDPGDVRLAGRELRAAISGASPVELAWEADDGASHDLIYVDVAGDRERAGSRCVFSDTGRATLAGSLFAGIDDGTVTVHRLHREAFRSKGIDSGEIRFDFARIVWFSHR